MKQVFLGILIVCAGCMAFIVCRSILDEQDTQEVVAMRMDAVKARLKQLAVLEGEYQKQHTTPVVCPEFDNEVIDANVFCDNLDSLIYFVEHAEIAVVKAEGELTAQNLDDGLTENSAAAIVASGDKALIEKHHLEGFRRDTIYVPMADSLRRYVENDVQIFGKDFDFNLVKYIPYSGEENTEHGTELFEVETYTTFTRSGSPLCTMHALAPYTSFLTGLGGAGKRHMQDLIDKAEKRGEYEGLKIGGLQRDEWNNNAGNWD